MAGAADHLSKELPRLGIAPSAQALVELRSAADVLAPQAQALSPADACPDNNVSTPDGLVLLDFEQATVRHVAWDVAYLLLPWPSCWCSWDLPADIANATVARWRAAVAPTIPSVGTKAFDHDLDVSVTRVLQTVAGRMIFAQPRLD